MSLWEIVIKVNVGKLDLGCTLPELSTFIDRADIERLSMNFSDLEAYLSLPLHHRDPFDRILISQGISRSLIIVSRDSQFEAYPVRRLWS